MPRGQPNTKFQKRQTRFDSLKAGNRHWTAADEGIALGYRRGKTKSVWYVRRYVGNKKYEIRAIGLADDYQDADGEDILTFFQAQNRAKERASDATKNERSLPKRKGLTVADAIENYLEHYRAASGKQTAEVERYPGWHA